MAQQPTLWGLATDILWRLRPAFSRTATFAWFCLVVAGMMVRNDRYGVTSLIRAVGLPARAYDRMLDAFHSRAWNVDALAALWVKVVFAVFPLMKSTDGRPIIITDGIKRPKSGRRMPGVKRLHQSSDSNSKREYINGHSLHSVGVLAFRGRKTVCVPLSVELIEGVEFSPRRRTIFDRLAALLGRLCLHNAILVGDAYYGAAELRRQAAKLEIAVVSRARKNAVAYRQPERKTGRGRPATYGAKVHTSNLAGNWTGSMPSPFDGDGDAILLFRCDDLLVKPDGRNIRFVTVQHPDRGTIAITSTDLTIPPEELIRIYALRFKIEVAFKAAIHIVGAFDYHFWMRDMKRLTRFPKDQYLHRADDRYRDAVRRKLGAYHHYMQAGTIAHGIMQAMALLAPATVWQKFNTWMRTMDEKNIPSEFVVAQALRNTREGFFAGFAKRACMDKFMRKLFPCENQAREERAA